MPGPLRDPSPHARRRLQSLVEAARRTSPTSAGSPSPAEAVDPSAAPQASPEPDPPHGPASPLRWDPTVSGAQTDDA